MNMKFLFTALVAGARGCAGRAASSALAQAPSKKPNILFIVSDDTGYGDSGPTAAASGAACRHRASTGWRTKA